MANRIPRQWYFLKMADLTNVYIYSSNIKIILN